MAGEGRFGVLHVPDFAEGMSSYLRIGVAEGDEYTWRDHTDGNRITTTGGDKVEIIVGDYEFSVLGRQQHQSGLTAKTGKVGKNSITRKGKVNVLTGLIEEETERGVVHTTYHGDAIDYYYGSSVESQTGSESPDPGALRDNPEIVLEKTWAKKIESYTGSAALPVPLISTESWIEIRTTKTDAKSTTDETTVAEGISSTTTAKTITSSTTAESMRDITKVSGNIESSTEAAKIISTTRADTDDTTHGDSRSETHGDSTTWVYGVENTFNVEAVNEFVFGSMVDVTIGAEASASIGGSINVTIGPEVSVTVGGSVEIELAELKITPADIKAYLASLRTQAADTHVAAVHLL